MNRDSTPDFTFTAKGFERHAEYSWQFFLKPERNNKILICDHEEHRNWTKIIPINGQIGEIYNWSDTNTIIFDAVYDEWTGEHHSWGHLYVPIENKYIGLCLMDNEIPLYGWIHFKEEDTGWDFIFEECAYLDPTSGVLEYDAQKKMDLNPNPAKDYIMLERNNPTLSSRKVQVKIYNSQGTITDEFVFEGAKYKLGLAAYSQGIYFCRISIDLNTLRLLGLSCIDCHQLLTSGSSHFRPRTSPINSYSDQSEIYSSNGIRHPFYQ